MTGPCLPLFLAGAIAVAVIGFATIMAHAARVPGPELLAMLLVTYGLGLAIGRLALNRKG